MSAYWFIFSGNDLLLTTEGRLPFLPHAPLELAPWQRVHHLPDLEGNACRAVSVPSPVLVEGYHTVGLRACFDILPSAHYQMAGKAREILYWDANTRFCGVCGGDMKMHTAISKRCANCGKEVWPSLATAVIVAITRGTDEILLVQGRNFSGNYLGLVAGFVETGETLEECVRREVREETHLEIKNLRYFGSQPWPYPSGLMVGFTAEYAGGELQLQHSELRKGGWYRRDNLPPIPGKVSIARRLIDNWKENLT